MQGLMRSTLRSLLNLTGPNSGAAPTVEHALHTGYTLDGPTRVFKSTLEVDASWRLLQSISLSMWIKENAFCANCTLLELNLAADKSARITLTKSGDALAINGQPVRLQQTKRSKLCLTHRFL